MKNEYRSIFYGAVLIAAVAALNAGLAGAVSIWPERIDGVVDHGMNVYFSMAAVALSLTVCAGAVAVAVACRRRAPANGQ